ncbi:hypothetical protein PoB_003859200 [Plakobranchus ocellatus]|uniref:Uncharacterized protein n=1 Tax=Plakobranchus ocellatus TaxID=259542 RepID=A0AAV4AYF7_9GAST|nr:hypothetical protein PoB_003859200 [Plakobranchus ocellatus]
MHRYDPESKRGRLWSIGRHRPPMPNTVQSCSFVTPARKALFQVSRTGWKGLVIISMEIQHRERVRELGGILWNLGKLRSGIKLCSLWKRSITAESSATHKWAD